MATIAEQLTSLANTKTAIKEAIVAKGVQVADDTPFSGYATKIGEISGGGGAATKFGASVDTFFGDVVDGVLQKPTPQTELNFTGVREIGTQALSYAFYHYSSIKSVNLGSVQSIGVSGFNNAFFECLSITSVNLSSLQSVAEYGMQYAFAYSRNITGVLDLSSLQSVGNYGLIYAFQACAGIIGFDFSSLQSVGAYGLQYTFQGCSGLTTISFPSLTSVHTSSFSGAFYSCQNLTEIHFRADMQATIEACSGYSSKFGAPATCTIYFDL